MVVQLDNFIREGEYEAFEKHVRQADYTGVVNPNDGVLYPDISIDIPDRFGAQVIQNLEAAMGWPVDMGNFFLRMTNSNTQTAPHQAHTDTIEGTHIMILYFQDGPKGAGTSLLRHKELGFDKDPITQEEFEAWERDVNVADAWEVTALIEMKRNRCVCGIWSALMHRAEPIHGFGQSAEDGRICLIGFYKQRQPT